jgi:lambda repressor-like predicted transcriptional regulator
MGRSRKNVDPKRVIELAAKGHTMEEIAAFEDWSIRTLQTRFRTQYEKGRTLAAAQIRRKQFEKALAGNGDTTMLIWLGKQLLGQRDKPVEPENDWVVRNFPIGPADTDKPNGQAAHDPPQTLEDFARASSKGSTRQSKSTMEQAEPPFRIRMGKSPR